MDELAFDAVYLARHGQTERDVQRRSRGRLDSLLTELGVLRVRRNAELLHREPIDAVFTSPIRPVRASAAVLASALGLPVQVLNALSEIDHGSPLDTRTAAVMPPISTPRTAFIAACTNAVPRRRL